jgi:hypothetical protein
MSYSTYFPAGALLAVAWSGGNPYSGPTAPYILFDAGRVGGFEPFTRTFRPPYEAINGTSELLDLNTTQLTPFDTEELSWMVWVSCGGSSNPYTPPTTQHVQDVMTLFGTLMYSFQQCQLWADTLGYGMVSNSTCRFVEFELTETLVTHIKARVCFNCVGPWS